MKRKGETFRIVVCPKSEKVGGTGDIVIQCCGVILKSVINLKTVMTARGVYPNYMHHLEHNLNQDQRMLVSFSESCHHLLECCVFYSQKLCFHETDEKNLPA